MATETNQKTLEDWWCIALAVEDCRQVRNLLEKHECLLNVGWKGRPQEWTKLPGAWEERPRTALHVAARRGDLKLMEQILDLASDGAAHEGRDGDHIACPDSTHCHLLKIVDGGYDLDALAMAVVNGNPDIVTLLKKASLRCKSEHVSNPYHVGEGFQNGKGVAAASETTAAASGKTIYQIGEDTLDPDYRECISALSNITNEILAEESASSRAARQQERIELPPPDIQQLYHKDADFNFLPISLYLFHFTFSSFTLSRPWSIKQLEHHMGRIRKEIWTRAVAWVSASEDLGWPGKTVSRTDLKLVKYLLFHLWDGQGRTALHVAVDSDKVDAFTSLLPSQGQDEDLDDDYLNIRDSVGRTPLYRAAATNKYLAVEHLLDDSRTKLLAKVVYSAYNWGQDLDIDKLSRRNFFKSDCVYIPANNFHGGNVPKPNGSQGGSGSSVIQPPLLNISSTALQVAIIHKHEDTVKYLAEKADFESLVATSTDDTRRFPWPIIPDDQKNYVRRSVSPMQLTVLVENSTTFRTMLKVTKDKRNQKQPEQEQMLIPPQLDKYNLHSFHLAAAIGNPDMIKTFLSSGEDPLIKDPWSNTALHFALKGKYVEFHPHIVDFVGCDHVISWRQGDTNYVSAWLAKPEGISSLARDMEKKEESEIEKRSGQRKRSINLLLQAGMNILQDSARPQPDALEEFSTWWNDKVEEQTQLVQEKLNNAANAISVTAALVATASYLGPLQPPLGYGPDAVQVEVLAVRIFVVCNSLSFYFALVAIMYSLLPSLPMLQESTVNELHRARILVAIALLFLLPSILCVLVAFAASYMAVIPDHGWTHQGLTITTTVIGGFFGFMAIVRFSARLVTVLITLPRDSTSGISLRSEFFPFQELASVTARYVKKIFRPIKNIPFGSAPLH